MKARSQSDRAAESGHYALAGLAPLLACPACEDGSATLSVRVDTLVCGGCKTRFPIYKSGKAAVPWLFKDPDAVHLEWRARFNGFLHANASEQARLKEALQDRTLGRLGRERVAALFEAREAQRKQIFELLAPLSLSARRTDPSLDRAGSLHSKLPKQQGLTSYYSNVFRDWSWDNGENDKLFECVGCVLQRESEFTPGKMLTLGAGAGRLSYDLHRHYSPVLSVALDINPLLVFLASRVIGGARVALHEFPIAPLNKASFAVLRECAAPEPLAAELAGGSFSFVLGDALGPPFKAGSFDTVVTPWLLDIVPQSPAECARAVNRQLKVGGMWINTGSLAFFHRNEAWCLSEEELLEVVAACGYTILESERRRIPYLQSPASAHGRVETVLSFRARKTAEAVGAKTTPHLPAWFLEADRCIPDFDEFVVASADHLLKAQILAAIDGRRTIEEIALLVAKRYGLQKSEAKGAVQRILLDLYESSVARKTDPENGLE